MAFGGIIGQQVNLNELNLPKINKYSYSLAKGDNTIWTPSEFRPMPYQIIFEFKNINVNIENKQYPSTIKINYTSSTSKEMFRTSKNGIYYTVQSSKSYYNFVSNNHTLSSYFYTDKEIVVKLKEENNLIAPIDGMNLIVTLQYCTCDLNMYWFYY